MRCYLKNSVYYEAIRDDDAIDRNEEYFSQYFAKNPQYHYGNVTYSDFSRFFENNNSGWIGRKIVAIPLALWSGLIKTIYHIAKMVLGLITKPFTSHGFGVQENFFRARRDLQEAFGRIASIFSDRYGSYHIQESVFHSQCYDCFGADPAELYDPGYESFSSVGWDEMTRSLEGIEMPLNAEHFHLKDFKNEFLEDKDATLKKFKLEVRQESFEKEYGMSIGEVLEKISTRRFSNRYEESLDVKELFLPRTQSKIDLALLKDEEILKMPFANVMKLHERKRKFVESIFLQSPSKQSKNVPNFNALTLQDIRDMDVSVIHSHHAKIPAEVYAAFDKDQLAGVRLQDLKKDQINEIYSFNFYRRDRLEWFNLDDLLASIHSQQFENYQLTNLSLEMFSKLKIPLLNKEQSRTLFEYLNGKKKTIFVNLLATLSFDDIVLGIKNGGISKDMHQYLPNFQAQFKNLPISKFSKDVVDELFSGSNVEDRKCFADFPIEEIHRAISVTGSLSMEQQGRLLSEEQIKALEILSKKGNDKKVKSKK